MMHGDEVMRLDSIRGIDTQLILSFNNSALRHSNPGLLFLLPSGSAGWNKLTLLRTRGGRQIPRVACNHAGILASADTHVSKREIGNGRSFELNEARDECRRAIADTR